MTGDDPVGTPQRQRFRDLLGWPLALVVIAGLALLGWWLLLRAVPSIPDLGRAAGEAGRTAQAIARAFREGTLSTEFTSYAQSLEGTRRLQVASLDSVETLSQRDQASILWGQLELPEVLLRATLPVTYTYYLDLEAPWTLTWDESSQVLAVQTPPLEWNRPAVDVSRMTIGVERTHPLRDHEAARERLRQVLTPWLEERAEANRELVAATAREEVEDWVRSWVEVEYGQVGEIEVVLGAAVPDPTTLTDPRP